jgi:undecaprenyl-diphosphatase
MEVSDAFKTEVYNAVIQNGAMLAALPLFSSRLAGLRDWRKNPETLDFFKKLLVSFIITGIGGLLLKKVLKVELPEETLPVSMALLIGGILFITTERWLRPKEPKDQVTWSIAIAVGLAQLVAVVFPGTSRSGATILIMLAMGLQRPVAVEFSFLVGIPTLFAAGVLTTYSSLKPGGEIARWDLIAISTVVAAVVSVIAVRWLLTYIRNHTFTLFGWYRIVLGTAVLLVGLFGHR